MSGRREGAREGGRDGRAESGGMAAKKLEPHTEMWGIMIVSQLFGALSSHFLIHWLPGIARANNGKSL